MDRKLISNFDNIFLVFCFSTDLNVISSGKNKDWDRLYPSEVCNDLFDIFYGSKNWT